MLTLMYILGRNVYRYIKNYRNLLSYQEKSFVEEYPTPEWTKLSRKEYDCLTHSVVQLSDLNGKKKQFAIKKKGTIGIGGSARVKLAQDIHSNEYVAMKIAWGELPNEIKILKLLGRFRALGTKPYTDKFHLDYQKNYIAMQYFPGKTYYSCRYEVMNQVLSKRISLGIALLNEIRTFKLHNIRHRDLYLRNIMISKDFTKANIFDFSCSTIMGGTGKDFSRLWDIFNEHLFWDGREVELKGFLSRMKDLSGTLEDIDSCISDLQKMRDKELEKEKAKEKCPSCCCRSRRR